MWIEIRRSLGYTTASDGTRTSSYETLSGPAQVQDLSTDDLRLTEGLNLQGIHKVVYLNGSWAGIVRADTKGGDVFILQNTEWLVTNVPESWPDWTKVIVTRQSPNLTSGIPAPPLPSTAWDTGGTAWDMGLTIWDRR